MGRLVHRIGLVLAVWVSGCNGAADPLVGAWKFQSSPSGGVPGDGTWWAAMILDSGGPASLCNDDQVVGDRCKNPGLTGQWSYYTPLIGHGTQVVITVEAVTYGYYYHVTGNQLALTAEDCESPASCISKDAVYARN
jgi:hypothetical protein